MKDLFDSTIVEEQINRINRLTPATNALWGTMSVDQMLAHVNVSYEMFYDNKHPKPNPILRFILKLVVKETVVGTKPYKRNSPTGKPFRIVVRKDFEKEKHRLVDYLQRVQKDGETFFEGKESNSFGALTAKEWNTMFSKHLDHHLGQFGV